MEETGKNLEKLAQNLKSEKIVEMPEWAKFVKTGVSREKVPAQDDWWYLRSASVLRKVYLKGPIGTEKLTNIYGGRKNRGSRTDKFFPGSGKIIRSILQQLEAKGLLQQSKTQKKGRILTEKGVQAISKAGLEKLR
ncbi:MAG: 30S ribosomal protein S19e [Candidatus Aenigmatarchaeota archaeon]